MFSREELLHIYEHITDKSLKRKVHSRLFVDDNVVNEIKKIYYKHNLFRLEKSTYENIYFVHLFGDFDTCSLTEEATKISDKDIYEGLDLEISIITHEDIDGIWYRKNYTQIYYTSPEQFLD